MVAESFVRVVMLMAMSPMRRRSSRERLGKTRETSSCSLGLMKLMPHC